MPCRKQFNRLLVSTALAATIPVIAWSQNIQINESELAGKTEKCRTLGEHILEREEPLSTDATDRVVTAINDDLAKECAALMEELQTARADGDSVQESEKLTEEVDLSEQVEIEGDAKVTVPEPNVDVKVPAPDVRITEQQPQIDVTQDPVEIELKQSQPQIEVEIPEIIVRVEIPAPKLYVLQSDPTVRISQDDPQVEVAQGKPVVTVSQGKPQLNVDINLDEDERTSDGEQPTTETETETADSTSQEVDGEVETTGGEAKVEIVEAEGQPQMTYESGDPTLSFENAEPQISVLMVEQPTIEVNQSGEPDIIIETPDEREQRHQQQSEAEQSGQQPPEDQAESQPSEDATEPEQTEISQADVMTVGELMDMEVVTSDGEELGTPEAFVEIDGKTHLVLASGGFLGIGAKEVPVPASRVTVDGERLVLSSLTESEIDAAEDFDYNGDLELPADLQVELGR